MVIKDGKHQLVGFVELGENHDHMEYLTGDFFLAKKTNGQLSYYAKNTNTPNYLYNEA